MRRWTGWFGSGVLVVAFLIKTRSAVAESTARASGQLNPPAPETCSTASSRRLAPLTRRRTRRFKRSQFRRANRSAFRGRRRRCCTPRRRTSTRGRRSRVRCGFRSVTNRRDAVRSPSYDASVATTFLAASVRSVPAIIGRPLSASILRASSTFVPSRRTTSGTLKPTFSYATKSTRRLCRTS